MIKSKLKPSAEILEQARQAASPVPPLTKSIFTSERELSLTEAYGIQQAGIALRREKGDSIVGYKMGLTSKAKMEQMGLHTPIYGVLLKSMQVEAAKGYPLTGKIHPKIEPEVAFITSRPLRGKVSESEARAACSHFLPALEILDSRYKDFKYFSLPDVVADNSSSCDFVLGHPVPLTDKIDVSGVHVTLEEDGKPVHEALSSAALGNPLLSLCELVSLLDQQEARELPAGSLVLTGALTAAIQLRSGQKIRGVFRGLGEISLQIS